MLTARLFLRQTGVKLHFRKIFILYFRSELLVFPSSTESHVEATGCTVQGSDSGGSRVGRYCGGETGGSPVQQELALSIVL